MYITPPKVQNEDPFKIRIRMLFVCTRMLLVCYSYVIRMYPYVPVCSVCYDIFYTNNPRIPTNYLKEMLRLILQENSFQFIGKDYLQIHGTAMGTKMAASFADIFMAKIETEIINHCTKKALVWKRYIDDVFSLWDTSKEEVNTFIEQANSYHPTIKFTAEISDKEITFLDTRIYKGARFEKKSILDTRTHFKPTETFQYTQFKSCHPPGVKKGFIKGEALRLLRTNSSKETFEENINKFKQNLRLRGYSNNFIEKVLSEVKFSDRKSTLKEKTKARKEILCHAIRPLSRNTTHVCPT